MIPRLLVTAHVLAGFSMLGLGAMRPAGQIQDSFFELLLASVNFVLAAWWWAHSREESGHVS